MAAYSQSPDSDFQPVKRSIIRPQTAGSHRAVEVKVAIPTLHTLPRPQSAVALKAPEMGGISEEEEWNRAFKGDMGGLARTYSRTELGAKVPGSTVGGGNWNAGRPGSARVSSRNLRSNLPLSAVQAVKRRIKPPVKFNGYTLIQAMALVAPYTHTVKANSATFTQREIQAIAQSKSVETFLKAVTGKVDRKPLPSRKPPLIRPWYFKPTLLDGAFHIESHTQEEKEAREVMDSLHMKFVRQDKRSEEGLQSNEAKTVSIPTSNSTSSMEIVGTRTLTRPMSASILRAPNNFRKNEKKVVFNGPEEREKEEGKEIEGGKKWEVVKIRSVELDAPVRVPKEYVGTGKKTGKGGRNRLVTSAGGSRTLPRSSTLL